MPDVPRKSARELEIMREAGRIVAQVLGAMAEMAAPGVSTGELDLIAEGIIRKAGGTPSFKGYRGYPATICVEPDDVVVHGIPSGTVVLEAGQILGIDVGAEYEGYHGDAAVTLAIGDITPEKQALLDATELALAAGIAEARAGHYLRQVCGAIQVKAEAAGYSVVRALVGHGIGRAMHEPVQVPNYLDADEFPEYNLLLRPGFTFAIEPMVNMGTLEVTQDADNWTVRTADGLPSAHFEHTVAVTREGPVILTLP